MITNTQYTEDCIAGCHIFPNETHHFKSYNSNELFSRNEFVTPEELIRRDDDSDVGTAWTAL